MQSRYLILILSCLSIILFSNCSSDTTALAHKIFPGDPFVETIVPSQFMELDPSQDQVLEGESGTLLICPRNCFIFPDGSKVEKTIKVELAEALTLDKMLLSNLTTTSDGKLLETGGMIYINATSEGKPLIIDPNNPIHIEIPTSDKKSGMMAYQGYRDSQGNINWTQPIKIESFIQTVDIQTLDFLPKGFAAEVKANMPYKNHKSANQDLIDSLYYSLSPGKYPSLPINLNEAYYNPNRKVIDRKYASNSYYYNILADSTIQGDSTYAFGIDPLRIKSIKSEKFNNTFIASKAFEDRLQSIFHTRNNKVLNLYLENLDMNLYEIDSLAMLIETEIRYNCDYTCKSFEYFFNQRLTKVKDADKYSQLLKGYYKERLNTLREELKNKEKEMRKIDELNAKKKEETIKEYKKILQKREAYRMESYGFEWSKTGWVNVDRPGNFPKYPPQPLTIQISNEQEFDRVYSYVIFKKLRSLYRLNAESNSQFYAGSPIEKKMLMPKYENSVAIGIAYKGDEIYVSTHEFSSGNEPNIDLKLRKITKKRLSDLMKSYESYSMENRINVDLDYMEKLYELDKKENPSDIQFYRKLYHIAFPACGELLH